MNDVFRVSESLRRQQRGVQPARRADLHAPLDPNDTIVPPRLEHLPIDAR